MKRIRMFAVIVALMLMAAACSSDDDSSTEVDEAAAPAATEPAAPAATEPAAGDDGDTGDDDGGDDGGDDVDLSGLGILSDEECFQAAQAMATAFSGGIGSTVEPGEISDAFDQLGAAAPSEIADDLSFVGDTLSDFYGELEDAGVDFNDPNSLSDPAIAGAIVEAGESLDTEEFNEALDNVDAWFAENCDTS
jgi:hypothetical protein